MDRIYSEYCNQGALQSPTSNYIPTRRSHAPKSEHMQGILSPNTSMVYLERSKTPQKRHFPLSPNSDITQLPMNSVIQNRFRSSKSNCSTILNNQQQQPEKTHTMTTHLQTDYSMTGMINRSTTMIGAKSTSPSRIRDQDTSHVVKPELFVNTKPQTSHKSGRKHITPEKVERPGAQMRGKKTTNMKKMGNQIISLGKGQGKKPQSQVACLQLLSKNKQVFETEYSSMNSASKIGRSLISQYKSQRQS